VTAPTLASRLMSLNRRVPIKAPWETAVAVLMTQLNVSNSHVSRKALV
jgi:hypothetical protein